MYAYIFLFLFLLLVIYLLFIPVVLLVNTKSNQYYIHLQGLAKLNVEPHKEDLIKIKLKVLFLNFSFYPLKKDIKSPEKKKTTKIKKKKRMSLQTAYKLLKSFKVKQCLIKIDTGNCITNAKLFPVFYFLNYKIGRFNINFDGKNELVLCLRNRPIYILKSFINI